MDESGSAELSESDIRLLTDARNRRWKLEGYEFAYDARIRRLNYYKLILEFLAFLVAFTLLFVEYLVSNSPRAHDLVSLVEKGLSIAIIVIVVWGHMARWVDQIEKKRELSHRCHELIGVHSALSDERPVATSKLKKWLKDCDDLEVERKHESATLPRRYLRDGHQHVGNTHVQEGVLSLMCSRRWTPEMNRISFWANSTVTVFSLRYWGRCGVRSDLTSPQVERPPTVLGA
jgi:hypothetical protein